MNSHVLGTGSLRRRLTLVLICGAALLALALYFAIRSYTTQIAQDGQDNILQASVGSMLDAAIIRDGQIEADFPYATFSMLETDMDDRIIYAIFQDGKHLSGYGNLPTPLDISAGETSFQKFMLDGTTFRLAQASRVLVGAKGTTQITVSVGQSQDALSQRLGQISRNVGAICAAFFLMTALLSYLAATTTINPLKRLANSVQRRGPQDLRAFEKPVPTEMLPLVSSLNSLMRRLDQSLTRSEDFITEAAHRVRTPLATVRSYADATLQRVSNSKNRNSLKSMIRAIDESSRAAGQLLDHAMITFRADHLELVEVDLFTLADELATRLSPIAQMKDIKIEVCGEVGISIMGDPILLQNAVRNLIDNALKYSPHDAKVEISVGEHPSPNLLICDEGPGFHTEEMEALTKRFERGRNASDSVGSGLGLTIAKDVAIAHGGKLTLSNRKGKGACVTLSL
ncbi:MAG: sensor histidine kinase [Alphaproteobacteria bacterium]